MVQGEFVTMDYKKIFKNRESRLKLINLLKFIPDRPYLKLVYMIKTGKKLNLNNPQTFCDKLNWLKLNDIHPEYTEYVDKVTVRDIVKKKTGRDICFPIYGAWEHYDDIDFSILPDKFVLKCNHDSGSVKIVNNKQDINHEEMRSFFEARLKLNPFVLGREYPYKDVKPKIMAEKFMIPDGESDINDYKFFCFDGKPELLFVATERNEDCKFDFYDMEFNHLDIVNIHPQSGKEIKKPSKFEEMKELAAQLSKGIKFVRIDLYEIMGKVYFGEFTFFHAGGFWPMDPYEWEKKLGDRIDLTHI